jgi:hypothetical protein
METDVEPDEEGDQRGDDPGRLVSPLPERYGRFDDGDPEGLDQTGSGNELGSDCKGLWLAEYRRAE